MIREVKAKNDNQEWNWCVRFCRHQSWLYPAVGKNPSLSSRPQMSRHDVQRLPRRLHYCRMHLQTVYGPWSGPPAHDLVESVALIVVTGLLLLRCRSRVGTQVGIAADSEVTPANRMEPGAIFQVAGF